MKKLLIASAAVLLFASCENTWDSDAKDMFLQSCMSTSLDRGIAQDNAENMCECRLEVIMEKYPSFSEAMDNLDKIMTDPDVKACNDKMTD